MRRAWSPVVAGTLACLTGLTGLIGLAGCSGSATTGRVTASRTSTTATLPGANRPPVTIGDKNFTEQFVLGQLYRLALQARGFTVYLNTNIGPTEVTLSALTSGRLDMYPEYLNVFDHDVAGYAQAFTSRAAALTHARSWAHAHGLKLLAPTPFSDTDAVVVPFNFAAQNHLNTIGDLRKVAASLTFGGPPQFQQDPQGLPALEQAYGFQPAAFKALDVGDQYSALDQGTAQAVDASTTDGQLITGNYAVLGDPAGVFGYGNVMPVVAASVLAAEGPAFARTIDRVDALLSTEVIRELNSAVDLSHEAPADVAKQFLLSHGLIPATPGS